MERSRSIFVGEGAAQTGPVKPSPADFEEFLPWACGQLQVEVDINITKTRVVTAGSASYHKSRQIKTNRSSLDHEPQVSLETSGVTLDDTVLRISTVFDHADNLVQIKFLKNRKIPRVVLKIIGLIVQFYIHLTTITIDRGLDEYILYELCHILPISNITDICLDNTALKENAHYHILLENTSSLRHLSLSRCSINDDVIKMIAAKLAYPLPASKTLSILNLSSNKISDNGVKHLAEVLRTNRRLNYLNLADNMISDCGASYLLDVLKDFPITFTELLSSRARYMEFIKHKKELIMLKAKELRSGDFEKRSSRRKSTKPQITPKKEKERELSSNPTETTSLVNIEAFLERATNIIEDILGDFKDPFDKLSTYSKNGIVICRGNDALAYLNLSYNDLSYNSVKKLLDVLHHQRQIDGKPKGLVNVSFEGNSLPSCKELAIVDDLLNAGLLSFQKGTITKKRSLKSASSIK